MKQAFRKLFLPWTAADCFNSEDQYFQWLRKRFKVYTDVRIVFLLIAALLLISGYVLNNHPLMLLTILPLCVVLFLSLALAKMEPVLDGQNKM